MQLIVLARITSLRHFTQAGSSIIACEGVVVIRVRDAIRRVSTATDYKGVDIPITILFLVERAHTIAFVAIGNVDTASIVVVVTVRAIPRITCPCYINLPDVVGAAGIGLTSSPARSSTQSFCWYGQL
jgi:hypothetical protein